MPFLLISDTVRIFYIRPYWFNFIFKYKIRWKSVLISKELMNGKFLLILIMADVNFKGNLRTDCSSRKQLVLIPYGPTPPNGQTATADELFESNHFVGLALEKLKNHKKRAGRPNDFTTAYFTITTKVWFWQDMVHNLKMTSITFNQWNCNMKLPTNLRS